MLKKNLSLIVFLYTISIIVVSIIPIPNLPLPKFNLLQPDKLFHFIVYFVMFLGWKESKIFKKDRFYLKCLTIVFLVGLFTEILQGTNFIKRYFDLDFKKLSMTSFGFKRCSNTFMRETH